MTNNAKFRSFVFAHAAALTLTIGDASAQAAAASASQMQDVPIAVTGLSAEDMREIRKQKRADTRWCGRIWQHRAGLEQVYLRQDVDFDQLRRVAGMMWSGDYGCRKDPALAIAIAERLVGPYPLRTAKADDLRTLIWFYEETGTPVSLARAKFLKRLSWVRGDYFGSRESLDWTAEEQRAFVASEPIWSFISGKTGGTAGLLYLNALIDPLSPRHDPATFVALAEKGTPHQNAVEAAQLLLDGTQMPRDPARAEALLLPAAQYDDRARMLLFPMIAPRLDDKDPAVRDATFKQLAASVAQYEADGPGSAAIRERLSRIIATGLSSTDPNIQHDAALKLTEYVSEGSREAERLLLPWLDRVLRRGNDQQKSDSWATLSRLGLAGNVAAKALLEADMDRTDGPVDGGQLTKEKGNLATIFTADDYPASALRNEEQGIVEASAIIAPNGRVVGGFIHRSASRALDDLVLRIAQRRARNLGFPAVQGRYVRAKLPPVFFKLVECQGISAAPEAPAGAIIVEGLCRKETIQDVPIPVTTISSLR